MAANPDHSYQDSRHRFDDFELLETSYKSIDGHAVEVYILIPKNRPHPAKKHPVFVKFHGGGLVLGDGKYKPHFASWLVPFVLGNNAVTVLPNYRLLPESNGKEIVEEDLGDFWNWYDTKLAAYLASHCPDITLDFQKLLVGGDSAGGLMAFMSGVNHWKRGKGDIKCILGQYPMSGVLSRELTKMMPDGKTPVPTRGYIDEFVRENAKPGVVVTAAPPPDHGPNKRFELSFSLSAYDRWMEFFGKDNEHLLPINAIEGVKHFPPTAIYHGDADEAVNVKDSREFKAKLIRVLGEAFRDEVMLVERPGMDHGFDCPRDDVEESEERRHYVREKDAWLDEMLTWVEERWLGGGSEK